MAEIIINGQAWGFASCEIKLDGSTFVGIKTMNVADEVEFGTADGNGSVSLGRVRGAHKASFDFEILAGESDRFQTKLGDPLSAKAFNVGIHAVEIPGAGVRTIEVIGAVVMKLETAFSRSADATYDKYTCHVFLPILRNGRRIVAMPDQGIAVAASLSIG